MLIMSFLVGRLKMLVTIFTCLTTSPNLSLHLNDTKCSSFIGCFLTDLQFTLLQSIQAVIANQNSIMKDIRRLKAVLLKRVPEEDDRLDLLEFQKFKSDEDLESFCQLLTDDRSCRDMFVSIFKP